MKIRALSTLALPASLLALAASLLALAALLAAPVAFADDKASPSPAHGGRIVVLGDDPSARFEVVTDASSGKYTLYAIPSGKTTVEYASPMILIGQREIKMTAVPGETNAWTVTDVDLKSAADARLRIRLGERDFEGAFFVGPVESVPAGLETRFEPAHGGNVILVSERPFEWVLDASTGTLTLYAAAETGRPAPLVSSVVLVPSSGKELTFTMVKGEKNTWRIEDPSLTAASLENGTLRLNLDGKPVDVRLGRRGKMRGTHGGHILVLGDDAPSLEMKRDLKTGMVTFYLVQKKGDTFADSGVTVTELPTVELVTASGPKAVKLTAVDGQTNVWTVTDPAFTEKKLDGTLKINVGGKAYETKLGWKRDDKRAGDDDRGGDKHGRDDT